MAEAARAQAAGPLARALAVFVALLAAAGAAFLAAHHPLSPAVALGLAAAALVASLAWPTLWLLLLPAALPLLGLAPWTGWLMAEEFDIAVLALAAGAGLRCALQPLPRGDAPQAVADGPTALARLLMALWAAAVALAAWRGAVDAGGLTASADAWWQGYRGPVNALRLAKPTLAMLLLWPLWQQARLRVGDARASQQLGLGLALGLGVTAAVCFYERLAYTGLLDFSSDYRSTGPFWEMHVGGAALDGMLALTLPFALQRWWRARSALAWAGAAALLLLAAYAALTTFSRIVYLALPLGVVVMLVLQQRQVAAAARWAPPGAAAAPVAATMPPLGTALLLCLGAMGLAAWVFPSAGYRGMLALLGNLALLLLLVPALGVGAAPAASGRGSADAPGRPAADVPAGASGGHPRAAGVRFWAMACALAVALGAVGSALALVLPKGPYLLLGGAVLGSAGLLLWPGAAVRSWARLWAVAGFGVALLAMVLVAWTWAGTGQAGSAQGGSAALAATLPVAGLLALALPLLSAWRPGGRALWPAQKRWQLGVLLAMALCAAVVGVFGGGAYMSGRLEATQSDRDGRLQHWRAALGREGDGAALWLGHGLGRFLDLYALTAGPGDRPGDIRLVPDMGGPVLRLVAGTHLMGRGEWLRLTQYIPHNTMAAGPLKLTLQLRHASASSLKAEVCRKHLLYAAECWEAEQDLAFNGGAWHTISLPITGPLPTPDAWLAPRATVLSLATTTSAKPLDVRSLSLTDASGRELLANGDLAQGGARWFFSSDKHHMPWHAKNLAVHVLFEQGVLGAVLALAMAAAALANLVRGPGRAHPMAPPLAAALLGVATVGAVDSLMDMPRLASLVLLLLAVAMGLGRGGPAPSHSRARRESAAA